MSAKPVTTQGCAINRSDEVKLMQAFGKKFFFANAGSVMDRA
jgi:hypothetical protein